MLVRHGNSFQASEGEDGWSVSLGWLGVCWFLWSREGDIDFGTTRIAEIVSSGLVHRTLKQSRSRGVLVASLPNHRCWLRARQLHPHRLLSASIEVVAVQKMFQVEVETVTQCVSAGCW